LKQQAALWLIRASCKFFVSLLHQNLAFKEAAKSIIFFLAMHPKKIY
jgi:hypothetical protein